MFRVPQVGAPLILGALVVLSVASGAQAKRPPKTTTTPHSDAIAPALGGLRWGMTKQQVIRYATEAIKSRYRTEAAGVKDVLEEDRIYQQMREAVREMRRSFVVFRGRHTGWESSFLGDEFRHGSNEAMLVSKDGVSRNYFFFINNRLWKWYRQFTHEGMNSQTHDEFGAALQRKFGKAAERRRRLERGDRVERWLQWQDRQTELRAVHRGGHFALVFTSKRTLGQLERLRAKAHRRPTGDHHPIVQSALLKGSGATQLADSEDPHEDAATKVMRKLRAKRATGRRH